MRRRSFCSAMTVTLVLWLLTLLAGSAWAQDPNAGGPTPSRPTPAVPSIASGVPGPAQPEGSGTARSSTWIAAHKFTLSVSTTNPRLTYSINHFYSSPGSGSPVFYFAPLELEQGLLVDTYTCVYNDGSAANDLGFDLQKSTIDFATGTASWASLGSGSSSGSPGVDFVNIPLSSNETIQNQVGNTYYNYVLRAAVSDDTSFAGCMVYWTRQISPAPATARFTDVPTSHQMFREIEALAASGVTTGCTPTQFCPSSNVTRAQMAAFLARALGLHYPK